MSSQSQSFVEIDPQGDLTLVVVEYDYNATSGNGEHPVLRSASFKVSREILLGAEDDDYWLKLLSGGFSEAGSNQITLEDDSVAAMELWLRVFHDAFVDESYDLPIKEVWHAIQLSHKYFFHLEKLDSWFKAYWRKMEKKSLKLEELKELMYPCWEFEHATAFAYVTKRLVLETAGHVEERNPTRFGNLHCNHRMIRLFEPLDTFCPNNCEVHEKCIAAYLEGVKRTGIWPLQHQQKKSNKSIIDSSGFVNWTCVVPDEACFSCTYKLGGSHIRQTREDILEYWDGLCLNCMDVSNPKTGDSDDDYWVHNDLKEWDSDCLLPHSRNTWYFSFMGRPESMNSFRDEQQSRKRGRNDREEFGSAKRARFH
ncbi:hypothetical protein LSUE1_G002598 [Lachnellula suecica]|uniref:Uncharacterized protein n=1 Tax=Lachnellula suecica TaxID=602035 RepID=A0A8T9CDI1_9HELO|nr:hypothetical protein LSUE1_G002598 [Lachnellula suecica]